MKNVLLVLGGDPFDQHAVCLKYPGALRVQAGDAGPALIEEELLSRSLFTKGKKVMVISEAQELEGRSLELIVRFAKLPTPDTMLVLQITGACSLQKLLSGFCDVIEFPEVKPWDKPVKIAEWILSYLKAESVTIHQSLALEIAKSSGNDRFIIKQELDKLINYLGDRKIVQKEDIAAICIFEKEHTMWELTDAYMQKDAKLALSLLDKLLSQEVSAFVIVRQLRHVCLQALEMCSMSEQGVPNIQERFPQLRGKLFEKNMKFAKSSGIQALTRALININQAESALKDSPFDESTLLMKLILYTS